MAIIEAIRIIAVFEMPSSPGIKREPSTALSMLMAGVITPSPIRREIPTIEIIRTMPALLLEERRDVSISFKTIVPPSPLLLRLMASHAYCTVTRVKSVQTIKDRTPITLSCVGFRRRNTTVTVYIGLVPMSPKTRPRDLIMPFACDCFSIVIVFVASLSFIFYTCFKE